MSASQAQPSSSSSSIRPDRSEPDRSKKKEEEGAIPPEFRPEAWCRRHDAETLIALLEGAFFGFPLPDAIDLVNRFGVVACEGAVIRTLAHMRGDGTVRRPRGWLISTLQRGKAWSSEQVEMFVQREWERALERLEVSESPTYQRLAREIRLRRGQAPENVVRLREAQ